VSTFVLSTFILDMQFTFDVEFNPTTYNSGSAYLERSFVFTILSFM